MMRHIKKFAALLLAAICTMMVLTGCVDKEGRHTLRPGIKVAM